MNYVGKIDTFLSLSLALLVWFGALSKSWRIQNDPQIIIGQYKFSLDRSIKSLTGIETAGNDGK